MLWRDIMIWLDKYHAVARYHAVASLLVGARPRGAARRSVALRRGHLLFILAQTGRQLRGAPAFWSALVSGVRPRTAVVPRMGAPAFWPAPVPGMLPRRAVACGRWQRPFGRLLYPRCGRAEWSPPRARRERRPVGRGAAAPSDHPTRRAVDLLAGCRPRGRWRRAIANGRGHRPVPRPVPPSPRCGRADPRTGASAFWPSPGRGVS